MAVERAREALVDAGAPATPGGAAIPRLVHAIEQANESVHHASLCAPEQRGMGTTVAALLACGHRAALAHVGDSRIYRLRGGRLVQLTEDHSLFNELVRAGRADPDHPEAFPHHNVITRAVGPEAGVDVDARLVDAAPGDTFLLCSDGLSGVLTHRELTEILLAHADLDAAAERLVARANELGGPDNITAVLVRWEEACATARLGLLAVISFPVLASAGAASAAPHRAAIEGALPFAFEPRPALDGSRRVLPARTSAPVIVHFATPPTGADVAALPRVERIALDGSPFPMPRPSDDNTAEVQAPAVWEAHLADGTPITGEGVTICDVDTGVDVFHPLLFRADGGSFDWIDVDGNGRFDPGVDGVDLRGDGAPTVLRIQESRIVNHYDGTTLFGSDDPAFVVGLDYLYADANGSGAREYGPQNGFTEADPSYGERLFVVDDVNGSGALDPGEKLVALGSSKIRAARIDAKVYTRGKDLIQYPVTKATIDPTHGTAVSGILVGGHRGLTSLVGIAPDAELVMATTTQGDGELQMVDYCLGQGARVILHEYAPFLGHHLDGSTELEQLISSTMGGAEKVAHVNPVGNLRGSEKSMKRPLTAGAETVVPIEVPAGKGYETLMMSLLWRDTSRDLAFTLEDPDGFSKAIVLPQTTTTTWQPGLTFRTRREDSNRGTARVDVYIWNANGGAASIRPGTWKLHVVDPAPAGSPDVTMLGFVADDVSGWGKGIYFPEFTSEEHIVGFPATADDGIGVAAYFAHAWYAGTIGEQAYYSGRGARFDGARVLWIAAPADPITAFYEKGSPGVLATFGGTSGAAPHVAGAAALLLQLDPTRSGDDVKSALRDGALADDFVGAAPNDDWGYGKLRIYRSLFGKEPPGGAAPSITIAPVATEPGEDTVVEIEATDPDEPSSGLLLDLDREYDGTYEERLEKPSFTVRYEEEGVYRAKVRVTDSTGKERAALAVIEVKKAPPAPPEPDEPKAQEPDAQDRGGCSVAEDRGRPGAWLMGAALALLAGWIRRRSR